MTSSLPDFEFGPIMTMLMGYFQNVILFRSRSGGLWFGPEVFSVRSSQLCAFKTSASFMSMSR